MQNEIFQAMSSSNGQPMFFVKAVLKKMSIESYTGIVGDYYESWEWEVFPINKDYYQQITQIESKLNPEAEYPVSRKIAVLTIVCSTIEYLRKNADRSVFMNKTVAHYN